jgi:hypothetical protein
MQERRRVGDRPATAEERRYDGEESEYAYRFKQTCTPIGASSHTPVFFQGELFLTLEQFRLSFVWHGDTDGLERQRPARFQRRGAAFAKSLEEKLMPTSSSSTSPRKKVRTVAPKLIDLTEKVLFGDVWEGSELSKRDRSLNHGRGARRACTVRNSFTSIANAPSTPEQERDR